MNSGPEGDREDEVSNDTGEAWTAWEAPGFRDSESWLQVNGMRVVEPEELGHTYCEDNIGGIEGDDEAVIDDICDWLEDQILKIELEEISDEQFRTDFHTYAQSQVESLFDSVDAELLAEEEEEESDGDDYEWDEEEGGEVE